METATNPTTGERLVLIGDLWKPFTASATGPQGAKAFLVDNSWVGAPAPAVEAPVAPAAPMPAFGGAASKSTGPVGVPQWGTDNPRLYGIAGAARETLGPLLEAGGMVGGGILGLPGGILGSAVGAGAGYSGAKGINRLADVALGNVAPATAPHALMQGTHDVAEGMLMDAGGRLIVPAIGGAARLTGKGIGKVVDFVSGKSSQQAATRIAREALGPDLPVVLNAMRQAPDGVTAGQAAADINSPTFQALVGRALQRDPRFVNALREAQGEVSMNALARLAHGETQTAARTAEDAAKTALNKKLIPTLETEIGAANTAGESTLQAQADRLAGAAANKVQDVRRFTAAVPRAENMARLNVIERDLPVAAARYTYPGELAVAAEKEATRAAEGSLALGDGARFAQAAADSLAAHGLKPLESKPIVDAIKSRLGDPKTMPGNKELNIALNRVADDIAAWTNGKGVIDGWALDSIRKNSINSVVQELLKDGSKKAQRELAARITGEIKPLIVNAIEAAGGTGYGKYLKDYAAGRQLIDQQRLGSRAVELFDSNPKRFVRLVGGKDRKEVEKIFGPGNYDLAKQMSADAMAKLQGAATAVARDKAVATQVTAGQEALRNLLKKDLSIWRLPSYLSVITSSTNKALGILENKIGAKTMDAITKGAKSGKSMVELLDTLPFDQRNKVMRLLTNPGEWGVARTRVKNFAGIEGAAINALRGNDNTNALND